MLREVASVSRSYRHSIFVFAFVSVDDLRAAFIYVCAVTGSLQCVCVKRNRTFLPVVSFLSESVCLRANNIVVAVAMVHCFQLLPVPISNTHCLPLLWNCNFVVFSAGGLEREEIQRSVVITSQAPLKRNSRELIVGRCLTLIWWMRILYMKALST